MRPLICTGIFPPEVGGPATYSRILATELVKRGHQVTVITYAGRKPGVGSRIADFPIVPIIRSRFKPWHYWKYFLAARRLGKNADIIYAQDPVSAGFPANLAAKILKKPFVVKITGDYSWEQAQGRGLTDAMIDDFQNLQEYPASIRRIRETQIRVAKSAVRVIVPSEYLKRLVMGWGVKESHIVVIYNAVEKPEAGGQKPEVRKKYGISDDAFLIVSSGRNVPWKGFELLKQVVAELQNDHPQIQLKILHDSPRAELHEYIRAADLYVLNTGYEGLSNTLVEVLHLGAPIITTNVCGNPEIIKQGVNGLLVDYNNANELKSAILQLYSDNELRKKFCNSAGFENFTLEVMIRRTVEVLKV